MRKLWLVAVTALLMIALGCGGPSGEEPTDRREIPDFDIDEVADVDLMAVLIAEAECEAGWECKTSSRARALGAIDVNRFTSKQECVAVRATRQIGEYTRNHEAAFDEGRLSVDRSRIDDCRQVLRDKFCASEPVRNVGMATCMGDVGLFSAHVGDGDHCNRDIECSGDMKCFMPPYDECYGTCAPADTDPADLADGQIQCGNDGCDSESEFCLEEEGSHPEDIRRSCEPIGSTGDECSVEYLWTEANIQCEEGLTCYDRECTPLRADGESCLRHQDCQQGLTCYDEECIDERQDGESCEQPANCQEGLVCYGDQCMAPRADGDNCSRDHHCADDMICLGFGESQCATPPVEGEYCKSTGDCQGDLVCRSNVCEPRGAEGESCGVGIGCQQGLHCVDDVCRSDGTVGDPCRQSRHCASDLVCSEEKTCTELVLRDRGQSCTETKGSCAEVHNCHSGDICEAGTRCWGDGFDEEFDAAKAGECTGVGDIDDPCAEASDCLDGYHCSQSGRCRADRDIGESCDNNSDCARGFCHPQQNSCQELLDDGAACDSNRQCRGHCDVGWMNSQTGLSAMSQIMGDGTCKGADGAPLCEVAQ